MSVYYTTASDMKDINKDNLYVVDALSDSPDSTFTRVFGATFNIPDLSNRLAVQKVDMDGKPVSVSSPELSATFALYRQDDITLADDGTVQMKDGAQPAYTAQTRDYRKDDGDFVTAAGIAEFAEIVPGDYVLLETKAPLGYAINPCGSRVHVDNTGVYTHAGTADDGIESAKGVGVLTPTMKQFATHADLDNTLEHITIKLDVSSDYECPPADTLWTETDEQIRLKYAPSAAGLEYALDDGETVTDTLMACAEGWSRIRVVQSEPTDSWTPTEDLSDLMLNNLFSRDAFVRVSDQPIGDLSIDKTVAGYEGMGPALQQTLHAKEFTYEVKLTDADGAPLAGEYDLVDGEGKPLTGADGQPVPSISGGAGTFTLKHGQRAVVRDLPLGARYTVTERLDSASDAGWTCTETTSNDAGEGGAQIDKDARSVAGTMRDTDDDPTTPVEVSASFSNAYAPAAAPSEDTFGLKKTVAQWGSRDTGAWDKLPAQAKFTFRLKGLHGESSFADGTQVSAKTMPLSAGDSSAVGEDGNGNRYVEQAVHKDAVMSDPAAATIMFNSVSFTRPGTFVYLVTEVTDGPSFTAYPGVSYSKMSYRVSVTIVDDGSGVLKVGESHMWRTSSQSGVPLEQWEEIAGGIADFYNFYSETQATASARGKKLYTDSTDADSLTLGKFQFRVEPVGDNAADAPVPVYDPTADNPDPLPQDETGSYITGNLADGSVSFGMASFDDGDVDKTYVYRVSEKIPDDAVRTDGAGGTTYGDDFARYEQGEMDAFGETYGKDGYSYDASVYYVHARVTDELVNNGTGDFHYIKVAMSYHDEPGLDSPIIEGSDAAGWVMTWENTHKPIPVSNTFTGQKTLVGRNMLDDESYLFLLQADASDPVTVEAVKMGKIAPTDGKGWDIQGGTSAATYALKKSVVGGKNGIPTEFKFRSLKFSKPGTFHFNMYERMPDEPKPSVTYDDHVTHVTVAVREVAGELIIERVAYENAPEHAGVTNTGVFVNTYEAAG